MIDGNTLYETYHGKVYSYLFHAVQNQHTAEDLCSEVFLKVYSKIDTFDESKSSISTWIYNITKNTLYDFYRTNHPMGELNEESELADLDESESHEEELKSFAKALQQLDESEKRIIVGKYYHRKTLREIGDSLGLSYYEVRIIHNDCLKKLKKWMQRL